MLETVKQESSSLFCPAPEHKANLEVVLETVEQESSTPMCPAPEHKANREVVLETVEQESSSPMCPVPEHKADRECNRVSLLLVWGGERERSSGEGGCRRGFFREGLPSNSDLGGVASPFAELPLRSFLPPKWESFGVRGGGRGAGSTCT